MQIHCKQCGAQIPAEHLNLNRLIAKCTSCNSVFSFADQVEDTGSTQYVERLAVPMPKRIEVNIFGGRLQITRRWFSLKSNMVHSPWRGNKLMNPKDITQLYCKESVHHHRNSTSYAY